MNLLHILPRSWHNNPQTVPKAETFLSISLIGSQMLRLTLKDTEKWELLSFDVSFDSFKETSELIGESQPRHFACSNTGAQIRR